MPKSKINSFAQHWLIPMLMSINACLPILCLYLLFYNHLTWFFIFLAIFIINLFALKIDRIIIYSILLIITCLSTIYYCLL
jgi:hypothetical protein